MHWFFGAAIAVAAIAAWVDFRTGNIPNWLTFGLMGAGPVAHLFYTLVHAGKRGEAVQDASLALLGALLCAVIPMGLYRANGLGGGDVKLFIGLGALLLPLGGLEVQLWSFCAAAVLAPLRLAWEGKLFQTVTNAAFIIANPFFAAESAARARPTVGVLVPDGARDPRRHGLDGVPSREGLRLPGRRRPRRTSGPHGPNGSSARSSRPSQ